MCDDKMPTCEVKGGECCRHCAIELGYYGPSDGISETGSSTSKLQLTTGKWNHDNQNCKLRGAIVMPFSDVLLGFSMVLVQW